LQHVFLEPPYLQDIIRQYLYNHGWIGEVSQNIVILDQEGLIK